MIQLLRSANLDISSISLHLFTILFVSASVNGAAQSYQGVVKDAYSNAPINDAHITIFQQSLGGVSDQEGSFTLPNLPDGTYTFLVSKVGYETQKTTIEIDSDSTIVPLIITLRPGVLQLNQEVVISAQRREQSQYEVPQPVSVLNQAELVQFSPRSAAEALMGLPGVWVQKTNHGGGSPFVRGMTGNQTLQMIDGIRLNNAISRYGPNQYFNTIDPNSIQRVEVVRGSGSVQYGSDAMGGVVQVFTKEPFFSKDKLKVGGNVYGKYMTDGMEKSGRGELQLSGKRVALHAGLSYRDFGHLVVGNRRTLNPSNYQELSADIKAKFRVSPQQIITFAYQFLNQDDVHRWDQVAQRGYQLWKFDPQNRRLGYVRWEKFSDQRWWKQLRATVSLNRSVEGRVSQREDNPMLNQELDEVNTYGLQLEVQSEPIHRYRITSGIEYYADRVQSSASATDSETGSITNLRGAYPEGATASSLAIFTLHTLDLERLLINYGGRINSFRVEAEDPTFGKINNSPTAAVGNIAVSYAILPYFQAFGSVNTGFRAPNIDDLTKFGRFDSGFEVPISNLSPEKSLTTEVGVRSKSDRFSGTLAVYRTRLFDLIARVPGEYRGNSQLEGEPVFQKKNFSESYIQGAEAEVEIKLTPLLTFFGSSIYTYGQNETANEPMRRIPPFHGSLGLQYASRPGVTARTEWLYASSQDRLSGGDISDHRIPEGGTPGWNVINLYAGYQHERWGVNLGVQNILDESYRTHGSGVDGYGRSLWLAVRAYIN